MKIGDHVVVRNYPNHYSVRWSGKVVKIEELSEKWLGRKIYVDVGAGKILDFLESQLKIGY